MECLVHWTIPSGRNAVSVLYANRTSGSANILGPLNNFLSACTSHLSDQVSAQIVGPFKILNPATGKMTGVATIGAQPVHTGQVVGEPVADATQILVQWVTPGIVNGRVVRGRTFLPGCDVAALDGGNLLEAERLYFQTVASILAGSNMTLAVWSRPLKDSGGTIVRPGSVHNVSAANCWSELATQRNRRNR